MESFLPTIKCSSCLAEVELSAMGDHVCQPAHKSATTTPPATGPPPVPPPKPTKTSVQGSPPRAGRMAPPPPIDPYAANRPFLHLRTSADRPETTSSPSPISPPDRRKPEPSPLARSLTNLDCAFPPFPRPDSRASAKSRSRSKTIVKNDRAPPSSVPQNGESVEDQERRRRSRANKHKREVSIDSKSLSRLSMASSRYGESISRSSTPGFPSTAGSRGFGNFLDEVPPLPSGPIKSYTPSPFTASPEPYIFLSKEAFQKDRSTTATTPPLSGGLPGFELGFSVDPEQAKPQNRHSQSARFSSATAESSKPLDGDSDLKRAPDQETTLPIYTIDQDFSVSGFARNLGLGDPHHTTNSSTSSSDASDATTSSSFSTQTSEPSSASEPQPPILYKYDLDSPTDPLFQQGEFKRTLPKYQRFAELSQESDSEPEERRPSVKPATPPPPLPIEPTSPSAVSKSPGQSRRIRCRGCENVIVGKSVSSADGRLTGRWHKACFVCTTCCSPFKTADFYVLNNNPYCAQHYHELNGSLCSSCGTGIEGPCLQTEEFIPDQNGGKETKQIFHPDCFRCKTCRIVLKGDYLEWNGDAPIQYLITAALPQDMAEDPRRTILHIHHHPHGVAQGLAQVEGEGEVLGIRPETVDPVAPHLDLECILQIEMATVLGALPWDARKDLQDPQGLPGRLVLRGLLPLLDRADSRSEELRS
ncbi:hypothetical protein LOZ64_006395 [Ophidiomyces ophidiicola]|nr:hypothetical protein LOZ64_006395 [Ophidiomyces ophidiicola]KAI2008462.1 hypothetical protein LOZ46_006606 [Ophidiomyces ophidiicola]KAI2008683.1 hypothetical protein LOZ50_001901 [Ophidiomyces ophidiicola]KAI2014696.1 hypothetical protein LOZ49_001230 [Ophidiomyces ophidiicola]KAI2042265.1 hypothetical protein LOZ44_006239 [Ophidiomyces ophidiicola]